MKVSKILKIVFLVLLLPLGMAYLFSLRCRRRWPWPEGMKQIRYAHRGLHRRPGRPENSLSAFRAAVEAGLGAELDVHLMADGNLAVIHDSSLKRTAGADVEVEDLTKEELAKYRLKGSGEPIPLLEDVLPLFEHKTPLVVELKAMNGNHEALCEATCAALDRFNVTYCIESFDPRVLMWLRKNRPEIIRGQLSGRLNKYGVPKNPVILWILSNLMMNFLTRPDFIAYDLEYRRNLSLFLARKIYGVQEVSWTVRDPETAWQLEADNCLLIFENF